MTDLYEVLGVNEQASNDEIRIKYKLKAHKLHPDKGGDVEGFKQLQHAYSLLSDPERRKRYDQTGDDDKQQDLHSEAQSHLANVFKMIIDSEQKGDVIEMVKKTITDNMTKSSEKIVQTQSKLNKYKKMLDRVINPKGANLFNGVLHQQILGISTGISTMNHHVDIGELMLVLLEEYEDTAPDESIIIRPAWSSGTTGSF